MTGRTRWRGMTDVQRWLYNGLLDVLFVLFMEVACHVVTGHWFWLRLVAG